MEHNAWTPDFKMRSNLFKAIASASFALLAASPVLATDGFGDAEFPASLFQDGAKSYHDAWCRKIKNKCRVRFQGPAMWVEGQGGIERSQLLSIRKESDGHDEYYYYVSYLNRRGEKRTALFLFANRKAGRNFGRSLVRFKMQDASPIPNYRLPASQGPQDTQGRDKSYGVPMNPYERPPITDWKEKTTP